MDKNDRRVTITLSGRLADTGPLDIAVIFPVVTAFRDALREMIRYQWGRESSAGRTPVALRAASALKLASIGSGSYAITTEIAEPIASKGSSDVPLAGLDALLTGAAFDIDELPKSVSAHLYKIQSLLPEGINTATIVGGTLLTEFTLRRQPRSNTVRARRVQTIQYGRLQEVDWARLKAQLHSPLGIINLDFTSELADAMREAARKYVEIAGVGRITADGSVRTIKVDTVLELDNGLRSSGMPSEEELIRAAEFDPFDFEHPDWVHDEVLDTWVENILNGEYKDL